MCTHATGPIWWGACEPVALLHAAACMQLAVKWAASAGHDMHAWALFRRAWKAREPTSLRTLFHRSPSRRLASASAAARAACSARAAAARMS